MNAIIHLENTPVENYTNLGIVTLGMMCERAVDVAASNGRSEHDVSKFDWARAKQELMEDQPQL